MPNAPSRSRDELKRYLVSLASSKLLVLPYTAEAALWHSHERSRLVGEGKTPAFVDGQIASIAATNDLVLVTRNVKDFKHYADLAVENWFQE